MNKRITDILSYFGMVGWLIAYIFGARDKSKFHLNQGLVLALFGIIVNFLQKLIELLDFIKIFSILGLVTALLVVIHAVFSVYGVILSAKYEEKPLPFFGEIKILK